MKHTRFDVLSGGDASLIGNRSLSLYRNFVVMLVRLSLPLATVYHTATAYTKVKRIRAT